MKPTRSLRIFAEHINQALADPTSKAAQAFHALGISQDELQEHANDVLGALKLVADANERYANTATKSAALNEILGRGFEQMLPALQGGASGFQSLMDAAAQAGITLDDQAVKSLIETQEKITQLGIHIRGDAVQAFIDWGPAIQEVATALQTLGGVIGDVLSGAAQLGKKVDDIIAGFVRLNIMAGEAVVKKLAPTLGTGGAVSVAIPPLPGPPPEKPTVPAFGAGATAMETLSAKIALARDQAAAATTDYTQLAANEERAAISVIAHVLNAETLSAKQRLAVEAELARAKAALQGMTLRQGAHEAKTAVAGLEEQAGAMDRAGQDILRGVERQNAALVKMRQITPQQAYGFDMDEALRQAQEQKARLDAIMSAPSATAQEKMRAYWQEWDVGARLQEQLSTLSAKRQEQDAKDVEVYERLWSSAIGSVGEQINSVLGEAIKSAFVPMRPEYWISSVQGPHGQPLMQYHRISPTAQLLGGLGTSILGDVGRTAESTVTTMLARSLTGGKESSLSGALTSGIFKMLGVGGKDAGPQAQFASSVSTFQSAVNTFSSTAHSGAAAGNSPAIVGGTGAAKIPTQQDAANNKLIQNSQMTITAVGAAGSLVASAVGGSSGRIISEIISAAELILSGLMLVAFNPELFGFKLERGGVIPSAAGGMMVGGLGGGVPAILHAREMVLPSHLSQGIQNMIGSGRGGNQGDVHMHFHGPADAPAISKWFSQNMKANANAVREMFRNNSLTPRTF